MTADERAALVALKDARVRIPKIGGAGAIYERELLSVVDAAIALIEADGKRLALAEAFLAERPHSTDCPGVFLAGTTFARPCTCWKAEYDAAKEAL